MKYIAALFLILSSNKSFGAEQVGISSIKELNAIQIVEFEEQEMMAAYRLKKPSEAIAIIEHGIKWLDTIKDQNLQFMNSSTLLKDIAVYKVRLAFLYKQLGDVEKHNALINEAIFEYKSSGHEITTDKLILLVHTMDKSNQNP